MGDISSRSVASPRHRDIVITLCTLQSVAILTTCFRLVYKKRARQLGWDDCWALLASVGDIAIVVTSLLVPVNSKPNHSLKMISLLILVSYTITLWAARLTISVTITRLLPEGRVRILSKVVSVLFGAFAVSLVVYKIYFCKTKHGIIVETCSVPKYTGIIELVTDIIADLWLVFGPAYMIFGMKLRLSHNRLILGIFTCGILISLASVAHDIFLMLALPIWIAIAAHIQVAVAIIVSNLLVLVTTAYRGIRSFQQRRSTIRNGVRDAPRSGNNVIRTRESSVLSPIDLTQLSTNMGITSPEQRSVSFLSTAPFSSFSYSTSTGQSMQSDNSFSLGKVVEESILRSPEDHSHMHKDPEEPVNS